MKRFRYLQPAALILLLGLTGFWWQRETQRHLTTEVAVRRGALRDLQRLRAENQRLQALLATPDDSRAMEEVKSEIARLRQEVAALESKRLPTSPRTRPPANPARAGSTAKPGVDPDAVRIADHQNVGQATPRAAFQTFVWAVAHDDLVALTRVLHLSPEGQAQLRKVWRELPEESRARYEKPERIVMMLLALDVLDEEAFEIVNDAPGNDGDVRLHVNRFKHGQKQGEKRIPMRHGPAGWQLVIPDRTLAELPQAIAQASLYVSPPEVPLRSTKK